MLLKKFPLKGFMGYKKELRNILFHGYAYNALYDKSVLQRIFIELKGGYKK